MHRLPATLALLALAAPAATSAQTSIGTVEAVSATVSGATAITGGVASLGPTAVITARDRTATLELARGGEILVCATSALHAARGSGPGPREPLLLALDRGAAEIHMAATGSDAILTPDLRFSVVRPGPGGAPVPSAGLLDLRIRVAANGDTCVENRGTTAPTLEVAEQFGTGLYQVRPNQHLLFEHGSLREVVDNETSACGCPPPPTLSVAENGIATDLSRAARPGARVADDRDELHPHSEDHPQAEGRYPFPAAESQGLVTSDPAAAVPQAPAGEPHSQIAATLTYPNPGVLPGAPTSPTAPEPGPASPAPAPSPVAPAAPPSPAASAAPSVPVLTTAAPASDDAAKHELAQRPQQPPTPNPFRGIGRFFRRLFGG